MKEKIPRLAIVDDQGKAIIEAKKKLEKTFELPKMRGIKYDLDIHKSGYELLANEKEYDLVLLDYEMPEMNGFEVAVELNKLRPRPRFVFLTIHDMPSKEMFEVFPNGYIYKSDTLEEFQKIIIEQIEKILEKRRIEIIYYETEVYEMVYKDKKEKAVEEVRRTKLLNVKGIVYLETGISKKAKTSYIYMVNGDVYLTRKSMSHWLSLLPKDEFVHSSKTHAVGLRHVKEVNGNEIIFQSDEIEPITLTRTLKEKFKAARNYYILEGGDN